jgi:hypothetical protein
MPGEALHLWIPVDKATVTCLLRDVGDHCDHSLIVWCCSGDVSPWIRGIRFRAISVVLRTTHVVSLSPKIRSTSQFSPTGSPS